MEGVPRLPMIYFELKSNPQKNAHLGSNLLNYVREYYQEDPNNYVNEIQSLEKLRAQAMRPTRDMEGCAILKRYYCQLCFLMKKLPVLKDSASSNDQILWKEVWWSLSAPKNVNFKAEYVLMLYNIGALHSILGAEDDRSTADGLKLACTHFQCAAWAFQQVNTTALKTEEFDTKYFGFLVSICLAQAQECILEKSMTDSRKPIISAKVAAQVAEYYRNALNTINSCKCDDALFNDMKLSSVWVNYATAKRAYYECLSLLYLGIHSEEEEKMGERVTYYNAASDKLNNVVIPKFQEPEFNKKFEESITFTRDVVEGKKKISINENDFIYHEPVPPLDKLPKTRGAILVRPIPVNCSDPDICGSDIFARLIPMKVHKISSIYSEEKAKLLRSITSAAEEKDAELNLIMDSFKFDALNPKEDLNMLPDDLVERCAVCNSKPDLVPNLQKAIDTLNDEHNNVQCMMSEIKRLIEEEEKAEKKYEEVMGTSRPPSIVATDLACEAKKYTEALIKASGSNATLTKAVTLHTSNLNILRTSLEELQTHLPKVNINHSTEDESVIRELDRLVQKVNQMKAQRATLVNKLRESIQNDDIANQLVLSDENEATDIITKELEKYQSTVKLIEQNLTAQDNILKALTDTYASYGPVRKRMNEVIQKRKTVINALIESYDEYDDVISKASKGIEFYNKLEANVRKLLQRAKGTCKVQQEEREQMYAKIKGQSSSTVDKDLLPASSTTAAAAGSLKLKHYMAGRSKPFPGMQSSTEIPSPYNPYYNTNNNNNNNNINNSKPTSGGRVISNVSDTAATLSAAAAAVNGISPASMSEAGVIGQRYYSTMSRPAPVGSEMTKPPLAVSEPGSAGNFGRPYETINNLHPSSPAVVNPEYLKRIVPPSSNTQPVPVTQSTANNIQKPLPSFNYSYGSSPLYNSLANDNRFYNAGASVRSYYETSLSNNLQPQSTSSSTIAPSVNRDSSYDHSAVTPSTYIPPPSSVPCNYDNKINGTVLYSPVYGTGMKIQQQQYNLPNQYNSVISSNTPKILQSPSSTNSQYSVPPSSSGCYSIATTNAPGTNYMYGGGIEMPYNKYLQSGMTQNYPPASANYMNNPTIQPSSQKHLPGNDYNNTVSTTVSQQAATLNYLPHNGHSNYGPASSVIPSHNFYTTVNSGAQKNGPAQVESSNVTFDSRTYGSKYMWPTNGPRNEQQQMVVNNTDVINGSSPYFVSQYGYQNHLPNSALITTAVSQISPAPNNSMTYMQANEAGINKSSSTYSTGGGGGGNVTTIPSSENKENRPSVGKIPAKDETTAGNTAAKPPKQAKPKQAEPSSPSYVDLLADLDFNVSDPVLTAMVVTTTTTTVASDASTLSSVSITETRNDVGVSDKTNANISDIEECKTKPSIRDVSSANEITKVKPSKDPFCDSQFLDRFEFEVEKFKNFVQRLTVKTLNGSIPLDNMWSHYSQQQESYSAIHRCEVADKNALKNRFPNDVPYDKCRVKLTGLENDYVNASHLRIENCNIPNFIITEAPMPSTYKLFWEMIWQYEVEQIVCLISEIEVGNDIYWPKERSENLEFDTLKIVLHSVNERVNHTERVLSIAKGDISRVVVQYQLNDWPQSGAVHSDGLLNLIQESTTFYYAQRSLQHHIVVHGLSACDKSGLFVLLYAKICEIHSGNEILKVIPLLTTISDSRKFIINSKDCLLMTFWILLRYVHNLLVKYDKRSAIEIAEATGIPATATADIDTTAAATINNAATLSNNNNNTNNGDVGHYVDEDEYDRIDNKFCSSITTCCSVPEKPSRTLCKEVNVDLLPKSTINISDWKLLSKEENKRRNIERFNNANNLEAIIPDKASGDPLNTIDPLWPIKKKE